MNAKSSSQMRYFISFFLSRCLPIAFEPNANIGKFVHAIEPEINFSTNCSKFAVECDWKSKNSQNVQNLGFFGKIDEFLNKNLFFLQIDKDGKFAVECVSKNIIA